MAARLGRHFRSNLVGYVALFIALGGTAYGSHPFGKNTISSIDIVNDTVKSADIKNKSVQGVDVKNATLASIDLLDGSVEGVDVKSSTLTGSDIANGSLTSAELAFVPALRSELDSHRFSGDHDGRYFTEFELQSIGILNQFGNPVDWTKLKGVPAGFADGVDDTGGGGPATDVNCSGCVGTGDLANLAVTVPKLSFDPATQGELDAHETELQNAGTINQSGNPVDWTKLKGVPAGFADGTDEGAGSSWALTGNTGTDPATNFLGTTDNQPLNLRVNNARGLRLEPASLGPNVIGGNADNHTTGPVHSATIAGGGSVVGDPGSGNRVTDDFGTIGGGSDNRAGDNNASAIDATFGTVGGGSENSASGGWATVDGGDENNATAQLATVGGGGSNDATGNFATVGGGLSNTAAAPTATVGGGQSNNATGGSATVGGGFFSTASGGFSTVAGGDTNTASVGNSSVGGGLNNSAIANGATVAGGQNNVASGNHAAVVGGAANIASGQQATIGGGDQNAAFGAFSFVAGKQAKNENPDHDGVFLFADSNAFSFPSAAANEFAVRSTGGARFVSAIDGSGNPTAGVTLASGGGSWGSLSDRASKTDVAPVSGRDVLDKLAELPVSTWSYETQGSDIRHIGPMAQDFARAFGVGEDKRHITSIDADGVALAAIKGLNERVEELGGGSPAAGGGGDASGISIAPAALAAIAGLLLTLAAALGAALALRFGGRLGGRVVVS